MAGLETHYFYGADPLVPELEKDADSFRKGRLSPEHFTRKATEITGRLKTPLRTVPGFTHTCDREGSFTPDTEEAGTLVSSNRPGDS